MKIKLNIKTKNLLDLCIPQSSTHSARNQLMGLCYLLFFYFTLIDTLVINLIFIISIVDLRNNLCAYLTCSKVNELPKYMVYFLISFNLYLLYGKFYEKKYP